MSEPSKPYISLGQHLKYLREQQSKSLAEVSGAVEIDELTLKRIESGLERPAEDILLLLISHFAMQDQEALQLWELAGYDGEVPDQIQPSRDSQTNKPVVMLLAMDMRTMYSDGLDISTNHAGVTLNFTQTTSPSSATAVARIGMSYEQAEQVLANLQQALLKAKYLGGPKALPPTTQND